MAARKDIKVYTYNPGSQSAKALAQGLKISRFRSASEFVCGLHHTVINWGGTKMPANLANAGTLLNNPGVIRRVSNKRSFFEDVKPDGPRIPEFTTDVSTALRWVSDGDEVMGRAKLNGKGGEGILFGTEKDTFEDFLDCAMFVKYKKKKEEFRVHFLNGEVIDIQQKKLRKFDDAGNPVDPKAVDFRIRNLANGFIFARNDVKPHPDVIEQATRAFKMTGLDFGAVDVIFNTREEKAYVLEINTAPGLMGTTLDNYVSAFKTHLGLQ